MDGGINSFKSNFGVVFLPQSFCLHFYNPTLIGTIPYYFGSQLKALQLIHLLYFSNGPFLRIGTQIIEHTSDYDVSFHSVTFFRKRQSQLD